MDISFYRYTREELAGKLKTRNGIVVGADGIARCKKCGGAKMWYYGYTDSWFPIACPCELEEDKRERSEEEISRYRAQSGIENRLAEASFNDFCVTEENQHAYSSGLRFAGNIEKVMAKGQGIYLYGKPGVGKTYLAACIGNMLLDMGVRVKFAKVSDILSEIKEAYSHRGNEAAVLAEYISADVAIFDDIGSEDYMAKRGAAVSFAQEKLFQLIDGRYSRKRSTVFTSNYSFEELISRRGIQRKTVERIIEMSTRSYELKGDSFRITKQMQMAEF